MHVNFPQGCRLLSLLTLPPFDHAAIAIFDVHEKKSELEKFYLTEWKSCWDSLERRSKCPKEESFFLVKVWVGFRAIGMKLMWMKEYRTRSGNIIKTERLYDPFRSFQKPTFARVFEQRDSFLTRDFCLFARPISQQSIFRFSILYIAKTKEWILFLCLHF